jgi:hypothetical protein
MSKGERAGLLATIGVAALISGPWFYVQLLAWRQDGHDYMLLVANIILTVLLWCALAFGVYRNVKDARRAGSLRSQIQTLKDEHAAATSADAARHAAEIEDWKEQLAKRRLSLFEEIQAAYRPPTAIPAPVSSGLQVRWARWLGSDPGRPLDKTALIRSKIEDNAINYYVHESVLGNPFGSDSKRLEVGYTLDGIDGEESVSNGGWLRLISSARKPRSFDAGASDGLAEMLSMVPDKVSVDVRAPQADPEAWDFACAIMYAFRKGGWNVRGIFNETRDVSGVFLFAQIDRWKYMQDARGNAIELAFRRLGVKFNMNGRGDITEDRIEVYVGSNL